jgi:hypothetical protein
MPETPHFISERTEAGWIGHYIDQYARGREGDHRRAPSLAELRARRFAEALEFLDVLHSGEESAAPGIEHLLRSMLLGLRTLERGDGAMSRTKSHLAQRQDQRVLAVDAALTLRFVDGIGAEVRQELAKIERRLIHAARPPHASIARKL